ncbi:MAG: deoxyhypusine synthase [Gemmataceae bacterium]|nr:deoxyhypusine synthase [Gemmataceae bacterium]
MKNHDSKCAHYIRKISQGKIDPPALTGDFSTRQLIDEVFLSYNSGRLREACRIFSDKMLEKDTVIGLSLSGALTPAGLGMSCLVPLIEAGFVDWIVSTGANIYHDAHFALGMDLHQSRPGLDDHQLKAHQVIRIYDIVFDYENLLGTDLFFRKLSRGKAFQKSMGTAEFHHLAGKYLSVQEEKAGRQGKSFLCAAYRCGVPVFTSSPGDSSIGMNLAALDLEGNGLKLDPLVDVNQSAAIVYAAKKGGRSAVVILGGGSPKNFILQTEPQIQEVLGLDEKGHDYFLQFTDARPDTGGLSGATPQEAMTWGKVDEAQLPDTVTCYLDSTVALPLLTQYAMQKTKPRKLRRLMDQLPELMAKMKKEYLKRRQKARPE